MRAFKQYLLICLDLFIQISGCVNDIFAQGKAQSPEADIPYGLGACHTSMEMVLCALAIRTTGNNTLIEYVLWLKRPPYKWANHLYRRMVVVKFVRLIDYSDRSGPV